MHIKKYIFFRHSVVKKKVPWGKVVISITLHLTSQVFICSKTLCVSKSFALNETLLDVCVVTKYTHRIGVISI